MIKLLLILLSLKNAKAQEFEKTEFREVNVGKCGVAMPIVCLGGEEYGASFSKGKTFDNGRMTIEYYYGIAYPSLITAKLSIGPTTVVMQPSIAVRVFPLTIGPQLKFKTGPFNLMFSYERWYTLNDNIATLGIQWEKNNRRKK